MAHVLFVCLHNAGRSQMSQAVFERAAGRHTASSAGTTPADSIHPEVVQVMLELGIDLGAAAWQQTEDAPDARAEHRHQAVAVSTSDSGFSWALGGGVDYKFLPHIAIRVGQFDFLQTHISGDSQNNFRYSGGVVVRF